MAASLVKVAGKVAGKLTVGGFALYGLSEVLSSQENTIKQMSVLDSKTRENIPFSLPEMPTQTKLRHSWNSGVQKAFSELDQAPQAMWDLGARGANSAKDFIKEQMK